MDEQTKETLRQRAELYETANFIAADPCRFLRWYKDTSQAEVAAFIAAMLSFGSRSQFIPKIELILQTADALGGIKNWLTNHLYERTFVPPGCSVQKKFYRFYSYDDTLALFSVLAQILQTNDSFGDCMQQLFEEQKQSFPNMPPHQQIMAVFCRLFADCRIVPKGKNSANKRLHMFLRWMVRQNSPVDMGFWSWYSPKDLLIPLDTHVLQQSAKLGLITQNAPGSLKTAVQITERLKEVWPQDPCKGDFALFGEGVSG